MDISEYEPMLFEGHVNYDAEPVFKRVILLHTKQDGSPAARTALEVIWKPEVCEAYVRVSAVYDNKVNMMLSQEEIEQWYYEWEELTKQLINNQFMFHEKIINQSDSTGYVLSLNSVPGPANRNQRFIKMQKQSKVSKLLYKPEQYFNLSEQEIITLSCEILERLVDAIRKLNSGGAGALKPLPYKMWARQNPRKESPYYVPADVTAGTDNRGDLQHETAHPLFQTLHGQGAKRKRDN